MSGDSPEQSVLRSEHKEYLADGLRLLSPRERAALLLRDVEGLPAEEVAKRLDCSKATVRSAHRECAYEIPPLHGTEKTVMKHPLEADLALHAGHDLGFVKEWRVGRHVSRCEQCRQTVDEFVVLRSTTVQLGELPADINWKRLASEMKANIRLGLEAGECVAGYSGSGGRWGLPPFTGFHTLLAPGAL